MDTLHTATVQTLLNEPLEEYNKLYSDYLALILKIHNYNTKFLSFDALRVRDGYKLRKLFKEMRKLQTELWRTCKDADYKHWELNPPVRGRPLQETTKWPRRKKKNVAPPGSDRK